MHTRKKLYMAMAAALLLSSGAALAQDQAGSDETVGDEVEGSADLGSITVTGSRLEGAPAGSPVFSIDREEMDARGIRNMEDLLRFLPQNYSSITAGGSFDGNSPRFSQGAVTANLRGLGEGATLVLVNGRRIAATPAENGTFTDISTLPFGAIERVEIMADGGSAIYGSDAVAGVINFIMKSNYRGSESRLRYEDSSSGGDGWKFEQLLGWGWTSGNITGSFGYEEIDPVQPDKADLPTDSDHRPEGGRAWPANWGSPGLLWSPFFLAETPPGTRAGILPPGDGTNVDPADIVWVSSQEWFEQTGNFNLLPFTSPYSTGWATPETDQKNVYLSLDQDFGTSLHFNISGTWSERTSYSERYSNALREMIPPSNYYNNFGVPMMVAYDFRNEIAAGLMDPVSDENISTRWNMFTSLEWYTPWRDWKGVLSFNMGEDEVENVNYGGVGGFFAGEDWAEAIASPDPAVAINPFGDGSVQRSELRSFQMTNNRGTRSASVDELTLYFDGTVWELPAGNMQIAVGATLKTEELDFGSFDLNPFTFFVPDAPEIVPKTDNTAYFLEVGIPLFNNSNAVTGIRSLDVNFQARHDDFEIKGPFDGPTEPDTKRSFDDPTYKLGVSWFPVDDLQIRASWGEAFMAPTMVELFTPPDYLNPPFTGPWFPIFDPYNPDWNGGPFVPVFPTIVFGGNPLLEPQTSETTTFGFDWHRAGLDLSVTYNKIEFDDIISNIGNVGPGFPPQDVLENPQNYPGLVERNAEGVLTFLSFQDANLAYQESESIDFLAQYGWESGMGSWLLGTNGTYTMTLDTVAAPGNDPISAVGYEGGPVEWRVNGYLDWSLGDWSANATMRYQDGFEVVDPNALITKVDSYTTVDVQATYQKYDQGWRLTGGVKNLFDEDFPFVDNYYGIDSSRVDFRRRIIFLEFVAEFQW